MKIDKYLKSNHLTKKKFLTRITSLAKINDNYKRFIENLLIENSLTPDDWEELVGILLNDHLNINEITSMIINFCRYERQLRGSKAVVLPDTVLGRLVSFEDYCQWLVTLKYYSTLEEAKAFVRYQIDLSLSYMDDIRKSQNLGIYLMWSTFNPNGSEPFGNPRPEIEELIYSLGLENMTSPILIFEYKLPSDISPKIPTICDAYAGNVWSKFFRRVNEPAPYGMTETIDPKIADRGKPEVVHEVIKAACLVSPLRRG